MPAAKKSRENPQAPKAASELEVTDINCPRCLRSFTCNAANIKQCQCWGVGLGQREYDYLRSHGYSAEQTGCLCRNCLLEIQNLVKNSSSS